MRFRYSLTMLLPLPPTNTIATVLGVGLVGILTFQLPFYLVLLPQLQTSWRLVSGKSFIQVESSEGDIFSVECNDVVSLLTALPKCFDPVFNSYGYCANDIKAEYYKLYGRLYIDVCEQCDGVDVVPSTTWLNEFSSEMNPALLSSAESWCSEPTRFYDPQGNREHSRYWFRKQNALVVDDWVLIFWIGGLMGFLIVASVVAELLVVYLLLWGIAAVLELTTLGFINCFRTNRYEKLTTSDVESGTGPKPFRSALISQ